MFMNNILPFILIVCMFLALLVVIIGVIAMAKNGNFNKKYSNKLMRMRVLFQGVAVLIFAAIIYCTSSLAAELPTKDSLKNSLNNKITSKISQSSSAASEKIETFITGNFENVKYLDFEIQVREYLKPSFNIMSVTELLKIDSGTIFNQTSITTHDDDETVNIGLGIRKLLNDNKVLIGSNIFYDQQFTNNHKRTGAGVEAISSVFDIRGNYYNAISGSKNTTEGSERALDGWDTQIDYHCQVSMMLIFL